MNIKKKILNIFGTIVIALSSVMTSYTPVFAEKDNTLAATESTAETDNPNPAANEGDGPGGAEKRGQSMIAFFAGERDGEVTAESVTGFETRALAVTMSNYFTIGQTLSKNITNATTTINGQLNKNVNELTGTVKSLIEQTMEKGQLTDSTGKPISAAQFLQAMKQGSDQKVYFKESDSSQPRQTIDFNNPAYKAAFKVSYLGNANGLISLLEYKSMRVDTFGNIWATKSDGVNTNGASNTEAESNPDKKGDTSTKEETLDIRNEGDKIVGDKNFDEWELVMPACVNPSAYSNETPGSKTSGVIKFPMNNKFVNQSLKTYSDLNRKQKDLEAAGKANFINLPFNLSNDKGAIFGIAVASKTMLTDITKLTPSKISLDADTYTRWQPKEDSTYLAITSKLPEIGKLYDSKKSKFLFVLQTKVCYEEYNEDSEKGKACSEALDNITSYIATDSILEMNQIYNLNYVYVDGVEYKNQLKQIASDNDFSSINIYGFNIFNNVGGGNKNDNLTYIANNQAQFSNSSDIIVEKEAIQKGSSNGSGAKHLQFNTIVNMQDTILSRSIINNPNYKNQYPTTQYKLIGPESKLDTNSGGDMMSYYLSYMMETVVGTKLEGKTNKIDAFQFIPQYLPAINKDELDKAKEEGKNNNPNDQDDLGLEDIAKMQKQILPKIRDLLSDVLGNAFRMKWIKAFLDDFVLSTHRAMTGTWGNIKTVVHTGSTYAANLGLVYTQTLKETPIINWIIQNYTQFYIIVMLLTIATMIIFVITGVRSVKAGFVGTVAMAILIAIPNILMEFTISTSNKFGDKVFSERFSYWAITQLNNYNEANVNIIRSPGDVYNSLNRQAENAYANYGVRLKWMAPKKKQESRELFNRHKVTNDFILNTRLFRYLFSSFIYQEEYVQNDALARYLYRPFNNIVNEGQSAYEKMSASSGTNAMALESLGNTVDTNRQGNSTEKNSNYEDLFKYAFVYEDMANINSGVNGYTNIRINSKKIDDIKLAGMNGKSLRENNGVSKVPFWGLDVSSVNSIATKDGRRISSTETIDFNLKSLQMEEAVTNANGETEYTEIDVPANEEWLLKLTESPYYYFYAVLKEQYASGTTAATASFKKALLRNDIFEVSSFSNENGLKMTEEMEDTPIIGATRDFLNLEGLFSVVIPYFQMTNRYVIDYTDKFGADMPAFDFEKLKPSGEWRDEKDDKYNQAPAVEQPGVEAEPASTEPEPPKSESIIENNTEMPESKSIIEGNEPPKSSKLTPLQTNLLNKNQSLFIDRVYADDDTIEESTTGMDVSELQRAYARMKAHKHNLEQLWTIYNPWVDQMTFADYNRFDRGGRNNRIKNISNLINPSSYINGNVKDNRLMVFSEADMYAKGYEKKDLTDVEKRIQRVLETTKKDLRYLVNYYDMEDETLLAAAAMYATFNFNREFSNTNISGVTTLLYPYGYELRTFNFDAYMRMLLMNNSGETDSGSPGIYEKILSKTSIVTGLLLLSSDVLGLYVVPTLKFAVVIMLYILALMLIFYAIIEEVDKLIKKVATTLLIPVVKFLAINLALIYCVSIVIGSGMNEYVGQRTFSANLSDPTTALLLFVVICAIFTVMLWKLLKEVLLNARDIGSSILTAISETATTGAKSAVSGIMRSGGNFMRKALGAGALAVGGGYLAGKLAARGGKAAKGGIDNLRDKWKNRNPDTDTDESTDDGITTQEAKNTKNTETQANKKDKKKVTDEINKKTSEYVDPEKQKAEKNGIKKEKSTTENGAEYEKMIIDDNLKDTSKMHTNLKDQVNNHNKFKEDVASQNKAMKDRKEASKNKNAKGITEIFDKQKKK